VLGDHIKTFGGSREINLEENLKFVSGGIITNMARVAIRLLFGD